MRELDKELEGYREQHRKAKTRAEKEALIILINRTMAEKEVIEKNLKAVIKSQSSLFGIKRKYHGKKK